MDGYLGETVVEQSETEFKNYTSFDWAMYFIECFGQIDGEDHKAWVFDCVAQIHKGTPVIISVAKWDNGHEEYRPRLGEPTDEYIAWVAEMKSGEDGENTYSYNCGITP